MKFKNIKLKLKTLNLEREIYYKSLLPTRLQMIDYIECSIYSTVQGGDISGTNSMKFKNIAR